MTIVILLDKLTKMVPAVKKDTGGVQVTAYQNFDLLVMGNEAQLIRKGVVGNTNWNPIH